MKSKAFSLLTGTLLAVFLTACNYTHAKPGPGEGAAAFKPLVPDEKASLMNYAFISQTILIPKCVSCHGNSGGVNLETYENVFAQRHAIHESVFVEHGMPKRGVLTDAEQRLLWHWLSMDCPKDAPSGGGPVTPVPSGDVLPTFDSINTHIIQAKCVSCHSAGQDAKRIPLDKVSLLNSPLDLVLPGNADESGLVIAVERTDARRMPLSTEGYGPLSEKEKAAIRAWITNGAKD